MEHEDDFIRVEVPMPLPYWPCPLVGEAVILAPIWFLCYAIYKWIYKPPVPPSAQFLIDPVNVTLNLCDPGTGGKESHQWPGTKIVELRKNQYHEGLHIRIEGILMHTFLCYMSDENINSLSEVLRDSIRKVVSDSKL